MNGLKSSSLLSVNINLCLCRRLMRHWTAPPSFKDVVMPEQRKLPNLDLVPNWGNIKPMKYQKRLYDMRGPELVHNTLMYKQYGIIALSGAQLTPGHINMIRMTINRGLDVQRMFAAWRIDAPWKPVTKKGVGKRMGGGKGSINHYVTPIKAGRIVVEVGGVIEFEEVLSFLQDVCWKMPCDAMVINNGTLDELREEEAKLKAENINPISLDRVIKRNMQGYSRFATPYDVFWKGKYV
ncbi:39S ribosomal protein L16, mitochondrial [Halotydeus destructor]|nr:39S ribosomal protein L16, mitochondrial [Halotydeus destructor]